MNGTIILKSVLVHDLNTQYEDPKSSDTFIAASLMPLFLHLIWMSIDYLKILSNSRIYRMTSAEPLDIHSEHFCICFRMEFN